MSRSDYMKVVGVLSKTLKLETVDVRYLNKSDDTLEITMGGPDRAEKKFILTVTDSNLGLSFRKDYMPPKDFEKWRTSFEYELEQSFMKNIGIQISGDASNHIVKISF